jgi:hypothetical protein
LELEIIGYTISEQQLCSMMLGELGPKLTEGFISPDKVPTKCPDGTPFHSDLMLFIHRWARFNDSGNPEMKMTFDNLLG